MHLYPLTFQTQFKEKIWGGNKIRTVLGKDFAPLENCGETWEISGVPGSVSVVNNGPLAGQDLQNLLDSHKEKLVGKRVYEKYSNQFPLLIKFIDANADLSIQVHPDDTLAKKRHNSFGKSEMWYILQADPDGKLIAGFNQPVSKQVYLDYFNQGKLMELLNVEKVSAGDVFYIPAGRIHTIGKGLLLAEIQQSSDVTYRIYDFDRTDKHGNKRELHTEQALDAIDYSFYPEYKSSYSERLDQENTLVESPFFVTNKWHLKKAREFEPRREAFTIYITLEGNAKLSTQQHQLILAKGDCVLIPAAMDKWQLEPEAEAILLETYIP